uniref:Uncharacterized protein n=1 Tax=Anguilla anguilla TaxID=7936 RepID=A0A0E9X181_ANGAN
MLKDNWLATSNFYPTISQTRDQMSQTEGSTYTHVRIIIFYSLPQNSLRSLSRILAFLFLCLSIFVYYRNTMFRTLKMRFFS